MARFERWKISYQQFHKLENEEIVTGSRSAPVISEDEMYLVSGDLVLPDGQTETKRSESRYVSYKGDVTVMESADDGDPGPSTSFTVLSKVTIPQQSIVIRAVRAQEPYSYTDTSGKMLYGKTGDTRVEVLRESSDGLCNIMWLERGWRSKRLTANFMKAFHYAQRVEQAIRMENKSLSPEVIDRDLLRRVV